MTFTMTYPATPSVGDLATRLMADASKGKKQRGGRHITEVPVHGGSKEAGSRIEEAFYRRLSAEDRDDAKRAIMEAFAQRTKLRREIRAGERTELSAFDRLCLKITRSVRDVFLALLNMERAFRGRVFPSYEQIGQEANCGRTTVWEALAALEAIGLIERLRRYVFTRKGGRYTSEQTSNAYRFRVPELLRKLFPFWRRPSPVPADEISRQQQRADDYEAMRATLTEDERIMLDTSDPGLGRALIALRKSVAAKGGGSLDS